MSLPPPVIDHVVITVGQELDLAAVQYERLGFALTARGHHTLGSSNHLAILGTDYIELLGYERGKAATRADLATLPLGLTGLVFKTTDSDAVHAELSERGVPVDAPRSFSRPVALETGASADASFRTVSVSPGVVPYGRTFFCQHFTPELVWRDAWRGHPNGAVALAEFVISTEAPDRTAGLWQTMFGADRFQAVPGGLALPAGGATVLFLTPAAVSEQFDGAVPTDHGTRDRMVALTLQTRSLTATHEALAAHAITPVAFSDRLIVRAADAMGLAIAFAA